jgi:DNA primase
MRRSDLPDDAAAVRRSLTDPRALAEALGLTVGRERLRGAVKVLCPWHAERTPSCVVRLGSDGTIAVKCHGCGAGGDALSLVAIVRGLDTRRDFAVVLAEAAGIAGIALGERPVEGGVPRPPPPVPAPPAGLDVENFDKLAAALLAGAGSLDGGAAAADVERYLERRGLLTIGRSEGWAALPPPELQPAWVRFLVDVFGLDEVTRSGLVARPDGGRELTFSLAACRLVIPWRDPRGRVYTLQRRRLDGGKPKYAAPIGRPFRWPYGVERLAELALEIPIAVVEGALDAAALRELERRQGRELVALGVPGVATWTPTIGPMWASLAAGRVAYVAIDSDAAGERYVETIAADLAAAGARDVRRLRPARGKDWTDMLMEER